MNKLTGILLASLALNAALVFAVVRQSPNGPAAEKAVSPPAAAPAVAKNTGTTTAEKKAFQWSLLASDDYRKYIANLRDFGVPEKVIRDIIMADVAKSYRPKFAAVRGQKRTVDENFWEHPPGVSKPLFEQTKEQRDQELTLRREQNDLVKSLLGADVFQQVAKDSGLPDWTEIRLGFIPPELRDKVEEIMGRYKVAEDALRGDTGSYDEFTEEGSQKLQQQLCAELAAFLTPEQVKEYALRYSDAANWMRSDLKYFEPNEHEFRALFDFYQTLSSLQPPPGSNSSPPTAADEQALRARRKTAEDALTQALGPDRAREFRMMNDPAYRHLLNAGVAKEIVLKVADLQDRTVAAAKQINANNSLTPEQRTEALTALQIEAKKSLGDWLNEDQLQPYLNQGGWWLRNLTPATAP